MRPFPLLTNPARHRHSRPSSLPQPRRVAFTLVEMLLVMAVIVLIIGLATPAVTALKGAGDVTKAAYDVAGVIENARSYAMANNTYSWVGFYEENAGSSSATVTKPPYTGKGQVVLAIVYAKDGTTSCQNSSTTSANPIPLTASLIAQLGMIVKVENIHLTDIGQPAASPPANAPADSLDVRSAIPYSSPDTTNSHYSRINSDSADTTLYPFVAQGYTFYKTIRFNPRGESNLNTTYAMKRVAELGLRPTHGTTLDSNNPNVSAVQITGVAGSVKIYRR